MKEIQIKEINVEDYLTKSKLPSADYVINPYIGCTHSCKYCYASFMKRFTGHKEEWGDFIDVKICNKPININKIKGKEVFLSSVTDCYNELEKKYEITRKILGEIKNVECTINISTKSKLILRDLDLLKECKNLIVSMSINTLNEEFRSDMDMASSIEERLLTLKKLHENGIYTVLFMSPIFPYITDFKEIIELSESFIDEYWFENLNLRGSYKKYILEYINGKYPELYNEYANIYINGDKNYWRNLSLEIEQFCNLKNIKFKNYFYHEQIVKN